MRARSTRFCVRSGAVDHRDAMCLRRRQLEGSGPLASSTSSIACRGPGRSGRRKALGTGFCATRGRSRTLSRVLASSGCGVPHLELNGDHRRTNETDQQHDERNGSTDRNQT
jgi:hypothetical protein